MSAPSPSGSPADPDLRVVLSTAPPDAAEALATALVEDGVAACVNLIPGVRSIYRWKGAVSNDPETLLLIKTPTRALPRLQAALRDRHTYEVPEIVALGVVAAADDYAAWVAASVPDPDPGPADPTTA